jgi:hypothetical protein
MSTVRKLLLERFPFARGGEEPDAELADALYGLLRTNDVGVTVDGWGLVRVVRESPREVEAVGLMWLLPSGSVPIAVKVEATSTGLAWKAQVGREDGEWQAQSESKRWKSVYLFASGERSEPEWVWGAKHQGTLGGQTSNTSFERTRRR